MRVLLRKIDMPAIEIRLLQKKDIDLLTSAFAAANWKKPRSLFEGYLAEQAQHHRLIWAAYCDQQIAGYVTLRWRSGYLPFKEQNIPEIIDFNVLPQFRNQGIGSRLLDIAENAARQKSPVVGIGVGLYADYGAAQRLYVKRGYIPDGRGVSYDYAAVPPGEQVCLDDELVLWFTKQWIDIT